MEIPPESLPIFVRQTRSSFRAPPVRLIVVIGAGIAGLTAARALRSLQYGVVVIEARDRFGGRICSEHDGVDFSSNYVGDPERNAALAELSASVGFDLDAHLVRLDSADALAYPLSGASLSLHYLRCGFRPILSRLAADLDIRYDQVVVEVDAVAQAPFVVVKTGSGQTFVADGVVCTVPISLLQEGAITFIPVPFNDSLGSVRMELLNNVVLEFPSVFWPTTSDTFTLGSPIVFQSLARPRSVPILIVTTSDPNHEQATVQQLVSIVMKVIRRQFPDAPEPIAAVRTAWGGDRFAKGAFPRRSGDEAGRGWWRSDVTDASPLAFAGDACTAHRIGNVQTAIKSAWAAAEHLHAFFRELSPRLPPPRTSSAKSAEIPASAGSASSPAPRRASPDKSEPPAPTAFEMERESRPSAAELEPPDAVGPSASPPAPEPQAESPPAAAAAPPKRSSKRKSSGREKDSSKPAKKERGESSKKERDGNKAIPKYISRLVKEIGPDLKTKHAEYIQGRVTERMIAEWKAKGCIADFLTSDRKQRIRHFVQKYVDARANSAKPSSEAS